MFLTQELDDTIEFENKTFEIDMSFDNILRLTELLEDKELQEFEKIIIAIEMLVIDDVEDMDFFTLYNLFMAILKDKLGFISDEQQEGSEQAENTNETPIKKEYDFDVDGERIYASFLMDYGIDLIDQQGKLHWKKFLSLFSGLSEKTPFMQVVNIRTMEVPKQNKHNAKERKRIQDLKRKYALEQPDLQSGLDQAATFLKRHATKKGGE